MPHIKKSLNKKPSVFIQYYPQFLLMIVAFAFFTRMYRLHIPEKYMFDEVYHAVTAKLMVDNDPRAYEWNNPPPEPNTAVDWLHPPYAKLTQAASMAIFGKNSFGWRFSSVIFGCLVVLITAKIAEELFDNKHIALLSAFLVSLDGLLFTMSRIAMNDVHATFFILFSIWFYLKFFNSDRKSLKFLIMSGIAAGLAVGTKWSGIYVIGFIGLVEGVYTLKTFFTSKNRVIKGFKILFTSSNLKFLLKQIALLTLTCIIIPAILYLAAYSQMFLQGKNLNHLLEMHKNTWWYQTNLTATHPAQSKPIQWFLNTKPVWLSVEYNDNDTRADIYAVGNSALFWFGDLAILATLFTLIANKFKKWGNFKLKQTDVTMLGMLTLAYLVVWVPWQLSPRIMFFYHYLPAVPLLTINLAYWINKYWHTQKYRAVATGLVVLIFINFVTWYPHLTLIPVSTELKENLYFYFDFWRQQ